jgi:hypothetical protein
MKKNLLLFLIGVAALSLAASSASATMRGSPMMSRPAMTRSASHFAPRSMMGSHRFSNNRFDRFHRFHHRTFVFIDTFGFPFYYPYPYYYGYFPYGYYDGYSDYGYGGASRVVDVQRQLARAGYYHGPIDGIMGPQTRRAIRAYDRDHNMPAYGMNDRPLLRAMDLG